MTDLEKEREASAARRELELDKAMAERIGRELWGTEFKSAEHRFRLVSDALARRPVSSYSAKRIERVRTLAIQDLERRQKEAKRPKVRRMVKKTTDPRQRLVTDIPNIHGPSASRIMEEGGIETVGEILTLTLEELKEVPYVGSGTLQTILTYIRSHGLELRQEEDDEDREEEEEDPPVDPEPEWPEPGAPAPAEKPPLGTIRQLEQRDVLQLQGEWGHVRIVKDPRHDYASVEINAELSLDAADQIVAVILGEKYLSPSS